MISVVMSVYNEEIEWIKEAVNSILNQTYKEIEFIIIIDNPKLDSEIKEYLQLLSDKEQRIVIYENEKNMGLAKSLNRGIALASGKYIARMDADDISMPNRLALELEFLEKSNLDMVSSIKNNIDKNGKLLSKDQLIRRDPNKTLQYGNIIVHSSVLIKAEVIKAMNGYRDMVNSEDYDLWLRLIERGYQISVLNKPLILYRIRDNSASVKRKLEQYYVTQYILKLRKERKHKGFDSFSKYNLNKFLSTKNFSRNKKIRFERANKNLECAILKFQRGKKISGLFHILKSLLYSPTYVVERIYCQIQIKKKNIFENGAL